ncbi:Nephrocystin-4 [Takifugu flavidus]|uniref:Nephrocystin-4 n=1 Tax=Takifugu flavidus TaxID=433684 RepID=A0A5C6MNE7_9TELE|nr:Nephrocystin-4 [Takifugu flavidus]
MLTGELTATASSRAAFMQCLRWGIWCPFQESNDWNGEELQLRLHGGPKSNPHGVMVYSTQTSAKPQYSLLSTPEVAQATETILKRVVKLSTGSRSSDVSTRVSKRTSALIVSAGSNFTLPDHQPLQLGITMATVISFSAPSFLVGIGPPAVTCLVSLIQACSGISSILHLEADLRQEGDVSLSAQDEGEQLQELPFTPVHAPVITMGMNTPRSSSVSSRSSLAHLYSAGFPHVMDSSGQVAEVLDPTEPVPFDPQCEETDFLQDNLLVFQFLAFTRISEAGVSRDWPENIYFTFQFYRFPPVTSQQLRLLTSDKVQQKADSPLPCLLASINRDGTVNSASPGLQLQFRVDESFLRPGEKRWFLRYLALHTMHIDIWDSDSLLLIGSTAIELKYMLRQGKSAVQALHEVEVLTTDYVGEETPMNTDSRHQSTFSPMSVHTLVRGWLHVRTGNIGCPRDPKGKRSAGVMPPYSHIITLNATGWSTAQANRLGRERNQEACIRSEPEQRKLERMAAVRRREAPENATVAKVTEPTVEVFQADAGYRVRSAAERSKAEDIASMLSQDITTQHLLFASLGSAEYMEFVLQNPLNVPQTVTIHSDDPELSVITSTDEWRYFKELTKTSTRLEENMFHTEDGAPGPRIYLRPKESVLIPLKYQSFLCDHALALQGPSFLPPSNGSQVAKKTLSNIIAAKTIKVAFKVDSKLMAILQVNVEPAPHVVDQTFRLYHPELCFLKKAIRLPPWCDPTDGRLDATVDISVRCSDPNIVCQTRVLVPGEPQDIYLKVPGSPSPNIKMFFVMVFTDKWMAAPSQIWQFYVHFLERVDVSCVTGQQSRHSLVLRGKQAVRKVRCYSSHPQEIKVDPEGVFVLPPASVQELHMKVQPWRAGSRFLYVNAVDVERRRLITSWLVCLNILRPVLSKTFEVHVPVGSGRGCSKKIGYTNPYPGSRTFLLRSDHPDLLQFKEDRFQIGAGQSYSIGLRFAPSRSSGSAEILVYVNNLEEKTEETFSVKVNYS